MDVDKLPQESSSPGDSNPKEDKSDRSVVSDCDIGMEPDFDAELDYDEDRECEEGGHDQQQQIVRDDEDDGDDDDDGDGDDNVMDINVSNDGDVKEDDHKCMEDEIYMDVERREPSEEGEIDDLEEGELKSDDESVNGFDPSNVSSTLDRSRQNNRGMPVISSSSESIWPREKHPRQRSRSNERVIRDRGLCLMSSTSNESDKSMLHGETPWEKGLRQAREMMLKASKKREEEPDFDEKRRVLTPTEDLDRAQNTDDDSDDSHGNSRLNQRFSHSPLPRGVVRSGGFRGIYNRVEGHMTRGRRYDNFIDGSNYHSEEGMLRNRDFEFDSRDERSNPLPRPHKIPSLIEGMLEGRLISPPRSFEFRRDEPRRPPKDLGPQVLYPNGRPNSMNRRRGGPQRDSWNRDRSPAERYFVPRRDSSSRDPLPYRDSRSPTLRRSVTRSPTPRYTRSPSPRRQSSPSRNSIRSVEMNRKREVDMFGSGSAGGMLSAGEQIRDPWDRSLSKRGYSKEKDLTSLTLGAELQKAQRSSEKKTRRPRGRSKSPISSTSREGSVTTSGTSHSRSSSRSRSNSRYPPTLPSLASAVASKNLIDDDGSLRATDLSTFRIPKKKRRISQSPVRRSSALDTRTIKQFQDKPNNMTKRKTESLKRSPARSSSFARRTGSKVSRRTDGQRKRDLTPVCGQDISSSNSSSSSGSSSDSDDAEPAAYRLKKKPIDDGLPTEGIPLSPDAAVDVSSDEDDDQDMPNNRKSDTFQKSHESLAKVTSGESSRRLSALDQEGDSEGRVEMAGNNDYVDNDAEKEERRAELLRQLKCVEDAIARKRGRPVV